MLPKRTTTIAKRAPHPETTTPFSRFLAQLEKTYQEALTTTPTTGARLQSKLASSSEARDALLDRQRRALETLALEYPDEEDYGRLRRAAQLVSLIECVKSMTTY